MRVVRIRFVGVLIGLLAAAGAFGVQSSGAASIVLSLTADSNLELRLDTGARIRPTSPPVVIPPGTYGAVFTSEVPDARDDYHMFHLAGPGVNIQTDLLAGDDRAEPQTVQLQPSSVYTFRDDRNPQLGTIVFSTSGAGTAVSSGSGGGGGSPGTSGGSAGGTISNTPTTSNKDTVGSKILPVRGTLTGGIDTAGRPSLRFKGKSVGTLKAGRYKVTLLDETSKAAFFLQLLNREPRTLSPRAFVGKRTAVVALKAGQWMFYSSPGRKTFFIVHA